MTDLLLFSQENLLKQLQSAPYTLGYYTLRFYSSNGRPAKRKTDTVSEFYLYPSGGTLRDSRFNIVFYSSRFDTYRGFRHPNLAGMHAEKKEEQEQNKDRNGEQRTSTRGQQDP